METKKMNIDQKYLLQFLCMVLCFTFNVAVSWGQEQPSRRQRATLYYNSMEYAKAVAAFERLVDVRNPRIEDMEKLADSYLYIKEYTLAENWYSRVVLESGARPEAHLN